MRARERATSRRIDILVNNAGVTRDGLFRKMDRGAWDEVINTNLNSVFDITQRFIDGMAARGWGRVINISSIVGRIGNFGQANYAAAKAGLIGFTKTLAREYARKGVTVNAIAPGFVQTRMLDGVPDKAMQAVLDTTPVGRLGDPMEIGGQRRSTSRRRPPASSPGTCWTSTAAWRCERRHRRDDIEDDGEETARGRRQPRPGAGAEHAPSTALLERAAARCGARCCSVPRVVELARETRVGTTPARRRATRRTARLLRYRRETPADLRRAGAVLLRAGQPRRTSSTCSRTRAWCASTCARGFDVYMIDWGVPTDADRALTLEDYVCGFLERRRRAASATARTRERVHLLGYCMGGTMSALFTALHPEPVKTLTLLAAPIDFTGRESLLQPLDRRRYFDVDALRRRLRQLPRLVPAGLLPVHEPGPELHRQGRSRSTSRWTIRDSVTNYFALEHWLNDNIPVAGETFREFVKKLYQRNQLVRGELRLGQPARRPRRASPARSCC